MVGEIAGRTACCRGTKGLKSQKTGKEYDAIIKVDFNDKYPKFSLEFPKTNKK